MDLFPHARRVLLTAYADTDAAIEAINVVDLDHYLLKPWDPPEEKLYPVRRRAARRVGGAAPEPPVDRDPGGRAPLVGAVVRGARLPRPQPRAVPLAPRRRAGGRSGCSTAAGRRPRPTLPVVITADGTVHGRRRRRRELAAAVGLATDAGHRLLRPGRRRRRAGRPRRGRVRRVGGAADGAGRAAGHRRAGRARARRIENYLGFPDGVSGAQLTDRARRQAVEVRRRAAHHPRGGRARARRHRPGVVRFADGSEIAAHAVVLATGVSYRHARRRPGVDDLTGRGRLLRLGRRPRRPSCAGQDVYIVGGANSAGQAAVYFSPARPPRAPAGAGTIARALDVPLPDRPDRRDRPTSRCALCTEVVGGARRRSTSRR